MKKQVVISIPIHDSLLIVRDQLRNIGRFFPEAVVVYHVSKSFSPWANPGSVRTRNANLKLDRLLSWNGVRAVSIKLLHRALLGEQNFYINPTSLPTHWGNILHAHLANYDFARTEFDFEYFSLLSSSCLLVRSGLYDRMCKFDQGLYTAGCSEDWEWYLKSVNHPTYQAIAAEVGATAMKASSSEGTYYRKDVFDHISAVIKRHYKYNPAETLVHEEIYFATIASTLDAKNSNQPFIMRHPLWDIDAMKAVEAIRANRIMEAAGAKTPNCLRGGHNEDLYGLRPVPRRMKDPLRTLIRTLS